MWWNSIFGSARYKWIHDKVQLSTLIASSPKQTTRIDTILRKILSTWNPLASEKDLEYLFRAINFRIPGSRIFPLTLIHACVRKLKADEKYYPAWRIIDLMLQRRDKVIWFDIDARQRMIKLIMTGIKKLKMMKQSGIMEPAVNVEHKEKIMIILMEIHASLSREQYEAGI